MFTQLLAHYSVMILSHLYHNANYDLKNECILTVESHNQQEKEPGELLGKFTMPKKKNIYHLLIFKFFQTCMIFFCSPEHKIYLKNVGNQAVSGSH